MLRAVGFTEGSQKFESLFRAIEEAQHHIHLMYFIVKDSKLSRALLSSLIRKVKEGVEVRFLYDDIGCSKLPEHFFAELIQAGGDVAAFFPSQIPYFNIRVNYRNHRKLVIIDGKVGYVGGINIGDEYLGMHARYGYWRDTHLRIEGSAVLQMQVQFFLDWNIASVEPFIQGPQYFPASSRGNVGIQIVSSGPNTTLEQIKTAFIKMIFSAKSTIYIQTPYFIPDESLLTALKMAALSGIEVKLMIPGIPDHRMVYWASFSYLGDLLAVGVLE